MANITSTMFFFVKNQAAVTKFLVTSALMCRSATCIVLCEKSWKNITGMYFLARRMLEQYDKIRPISSEEWENLQIRFTYPEKYWKLANYYFSHNKAWISGKNTEKLEKVIAQKKIWGISLKTALENPLSSAENPLSSAKTLTIQGKRYIYR